MPSSCVQGLRRPVTSTTALVAQPQPGAGGQREQVHAAGGDVLAHLAGRDVEAAGRQLVVQLGVDQVHLAQVGLRRVAPHARAVLHGRAGVGVAFHAEALEQADRLPRSPWAERAQSYG